MKNTNKKTIVAGIVVCAVSTAATASNNTATANDLSVNEIKFVSQKQNTEASILSNELEDSMLLKKQIFPIDGLKLAGTEPKGGVKDGKVRFVPSAKSSDSFWDWIFG